MVIKVKIKIATTYNQYHIIPSFSHKEKWKKNITQKTAKSSAHSK